MNALAQAATDDPAKLPRRAGHYAALQKRTGVGDDKAQLLPDMDRSRVRPFNQR